MADISVCIHAFVICDDGSETYCDFSAGEVASGWCVYTRRDSDDDSAPFDIDDETDFPADDYIEAYTEACRRANALGARVIRY